MSPEIKKYNTRSSNKKEIVKNKKINPPNDEDNSSDEEINDLEYKKFLSKLFPSKYMKDKVKEEEMKKEDSVIKSKKKNIKEDNTDMKNFNIVFTIQDKEDEYDDFDEEYDSEDEDYKTEDEDEEVSDSETEDDENISSDEEDEEEEEEKEESPKKKKDSSDVILEIMNKINQMEKSEMNVNDEDIIKQLNIIKKKYNNNPLIHNCLKQCKNEMRRQIEKKERKEEKQKEKNERIFRKIIKSKNMLDDYQYFVKLDIENQKKIIKQIKEMNNMMKVDKPYRLSLIESDLPAIFKVTAMKKLGSLKNMDPGSGEYCKIKNWVDTFMRIPFGKTEKLPINIKDGIDSCHEFMENAQKILDKAVYGLNDAKMQIMQILGQLIMNPSSIGTAIAIHGPPGSGKTSLVKEGISKILNRPFAFIALGGATDSSFLEGHSYTYEGSTWGKIVQILIDSKTMNPVIYFDELDKISDTPKGEEIVSILTHLTDTTQNNQFHDKYFSEIDFDLSKCIFIFSYNDESKVNPILKDRMYRIKTKGYDMKQKTIISNQYLLPKIREQVVFEEKDIIIPDDTTQYIIENFCCNENGVRNLKRCFEIIHTKLNLFRLMKSDKNLFEKDLELKVQFPFTVTKQHVDKLIKREDENLIYKNLYI
jgi:ATP-dependent Lon protease